VRVPTKPDVRAATPPVATEEVDVRSLEHELHRSTEAEVRFTASFSIGSAARRRSGTA
jgi:hypothetical protein